MGGLNAATAYELHILAVSDVGQRLSATTIVVTTSHAGAQSPPLIFFLF